MVLHSATHLFQDGEFWHGLRDLLDLHDLLGLFAQEPRFWPDLLERADGLKLQVPLSHALTHLERMFGQLVPAEHVERLRRWGGRGLRRWMMARLLQIALRPEHPSCERPWSKSARFLLYVRSHYLRMPVHLVVPHLVRKAFVRAEA